MADEEVAAAAAEEVATSPAASEHKRKLEDLDSEEAPKQEISSPQPAETLAPPNADAETEELQNGIEKEEETIGVEKEEEILGAAPDAKRPRLEEETNGSVADFEQQAQKVEETSTENSQHPPTERIEQSAAEVPQQGDLTTAVSQQGDLTTGVSQQGDLTTAVSQQGDLTTGVSQQGDLTTAVSQQGDLTTGVSQQGDLTTAVSQQGDLTTGVSQQGDLTAGVPQQGDLTTGEQGSLVTGVPQQGEQGNLVMVVPQRVPPLEQPKIDLQASSRKIEVPNAKVGVLIGKAGDTIRYLQYNSGARIQITRDVDADPYSSTRSVELIGTVENIEKAEKLIKDVIAEAEAGGSPALVARGFGTAPSGSEQIQIQVPYEKVGLIIGKGGETIKNLQTKTGARIQVILQNLAEGDTPKERTVRVTGTKEQIETARELIKEVLSQVPRPSPLSGSYSQQTYRPRGPPGPSQWGPRAPPPAQPTSYDYQQRGMYPSQTSQYPPQAYSGYPQQQAPRSNFPGWDQRPPGPMQGPTQSGGYGYYGQGGYTADAPPPAVSAPPAGSAAPTPVASGHAPNHMNYNYGQPQVPMQPTTYPQPVPPQQSYGHGYDNSRYENQAPAPHAYGGHGSSQQGPYPSQGADSSYMQQSYNKPAYGMPSQGPPPQSYGPPRPAQPGEVPYQGPVSSSHMQGPPGPSQQPYPYTSGGPPQQSYPYGSAPVTNDGYTQTSVPAAVPGYTQPGGQVAPVYPQQGGQPGPVYAQQGGQPAPGYAQQGVQAAPGYAQQSGQYPPSQPAYGEQMAPNNTSYGYQAPADTGYNSMPAPAYVAPASGQPAYVQPAPNQSGYEQPMPQSGYGGHVGTAPAGYAKTVSPQPGYAPQYESGQVYGHH